MLPTDMAILNSMVAARQEQVATSIWESNRPLSLLVTLGSLMVRAGQWLQHDPAATEKVTREIASRKRPQLA